MNCLITPYNMAFPDSQSQRVIIFDLLIDAFFFIDIVLNFHMAYISNDFDLIDDRKVGTISLIFSR
jgi:hypothetical protein